MRTHTLIHGVIAFGMVNGNVHRHVEVPAEFRLQQMLMAGEELLIPKRFTRLDTLLIAVRSAQDLSAEGLVLAQCGETVFDLVRGPVQIGRGGHVDAAMPTGHELRLINRSDHDIEFEVLLGFEPEPAAEAAAEAEAAVTDDGEPAAAKSTRRRREPAATAAG